MAVAIDFFSGVGGLSLGLEQAGFEVKIEVELEEITGRYAQYNSPATQVLYGNERGDIRRFSSKQCRPLQEVVEEHGHIDLIAGGPPCQGFSLAGKKNADDPLNDLILEFARIILEIKPSAFLIENVPGIKIGGSDKLKQTLDLLSTFYQITEPTTMNAWDFGVPQTRKRVFILGYLRDFNIFPTFPMPTHVFSRGAQSSLFLEQSPSCWEAISDLPDCDKYEHLLSGDRVQYDAEPQNEFQRTMRGLGNQRDYNHSLAWDSAICSNVRRTQHGVDLLQRFGQLKFGESDKKSAIRRLVPTELSTTIRAGTTKERGSWSAPRPLHPYLNRVITTRECARIQTFPDAWVFHPSKWHGNRMVGNAVPPMLAKAIGKHIIAELNLTPVDRSHSVIERDHSLIEVDLEKAENSGYEKRKVSQYVASWGKNKQ